MEPFDQFPTTSYGWHRLNKGGVKGNTTSAIEPTQYGIFKQRSSVIRGNNNEEVVTADAKLKVPPTDPFVIEKNYQLEGEAVNVLGVDYRVVSQSEGKDFDTGIVHFYNLVLKRVKL